MIRTPVRSNNSKTPTTSDDMTGLVENVVSMMNSPDPLTKPKSTMTGLVENVVSMLRSPERGRTKEQITVHVETTVARIKQQLFASDITVPVETTVAPIKHSLPDAFSALIQFVALAVEAVI